MSESIWAKITRHLAEGDIHPETLVSGVKQSIEWINTFRIAKAHIEHVLVEEAFKEQEGLTRISVPLKVGKRRIASVDILEFPADSIVKCEVLPNERMNCVEYLSRNRNAILTFDGPTRMVDGWPNNGFYFKDTGLQFPFRETFPPGERRGAIAFYENGRVEILDDTSKWQVVKNDFNDLSVLSGTSLYFSDTDRVTEESFGRANERSKVSYFVEFIDKNGLQRFGYMVAMDMITKLVSKVVLDEVAEKQNWFSYRVAELELVGSNAVIRNSKTKRAGRLNDGGSGHQTYEHYYVLRQSN